MTNDQKASVEWRGEVPVSTRFDDPYYSLDDGPAETRHVFLDGNDLPARFKPGFHIAELGFGTGLNMLCAWAAWEASGQSSPLRYTGFEAFPLSTDDFAKALAPFGGLKSAELIEAWPERRLTTATLDLTILEGDARQTLTQWDGQADAWFLDGFAPVRNPELWQPDLMRQVAMHTAVGGSFATYTAAGFVRRALEEAGFAVQRVPGFGRKRHMSRGRLTAG